MTEEELYNYYYTQYLNDFNNVVNGNVKPRLYVGSTSKKADELAASSLPQDEWSRRIALKAAKDVLSKNGYDMNKLGNSLLTYNGTQGRRWTKDYRVGNTIAAATLLAEQQAQKKKKKKDDRVGISNPNNIQQDPEQLAMSIISNLQNAQPIDSLIALVPDSPDDLYKSAFIYTIAANYPAKTPEVAKEMQALAQRHQLKATQWKASQKSKLSMNDLLTIGGFNNKNTVKAQEAIK